MSELAVLYELDTEPETPDLTLAAVAMACRMSYTSVNTAVTEYTNGARPAAGTLAHTAVMCWLAVVEYARITGAGDASHSAKAGTAVGSSLSENDVDQRVPVLTRAYVGK